MVSHGRTLNAGSAGTSAFAQAENGAQIIGPGRIAAVAMRKPNRHVRSGEAQGRLGLVVQWSMRMVSGNRYLEDRRRLIHH